MGYTYYWHKNIAADDEVFRKKYAELLPIVQQIVRHGHVPLESTLSPECIIINGTDGSGLETFVWLPGKGKEGRGYELNPDEGINHQRKHATKFTMGALSSCKTNRCEYDTIVTAVLCAIQYVYGSELVNISNDDDIDGEDVTSDLFDRVLLMMHEQKAATTVVHSSFEETVPGGTFMQRELTPVAQEHEGTHHTIKKKILDELTEDETNDLPSLMRVFNDPNTLWKTCGCSYVSLYGLRTTAYVITDKVRQAIDLETIAQINERSLQLHKEPLKLTIVVPHVNFAKYLTEQDYTFQETSLELTQKGITVWKGAFHNTVLVPDPACAETNLNSGMAVVIHPKGHVEIHKTPVPNMMYLILSGQSLQNQHVMLGDKEYKLTCTRRSKTLPRAALCKPQQERLRGMRQFVLGVPFKRCVSSGGMINSPPLRTQSMHTLVGSRDGCVMRGAFILLRRKFM